MTGDLTEQEREVCDYLVGAWNAFVHLESTHPSDTPDFIRAIHECQRIMSARQARRFDPDTWITYKEGC